MRKHLRDLSSFLKRRRISFFPTLHWRSRGEWGCFRTVVVTTVPRFQLEKTIEQITDYLDFVMTGYEVGCDKSNPKMY